MRPPPKSNDSPGRLAWLALSGFGLWMLGVIFEWGLRPLPLRPITSMPGFFTLCVGGGIGFAVLDRYFPRWATIAYLVPIFLIVMTQMRNDTSTLPVLAYGGTYQLARFALRLTMPSED